MTIEVLDTWTITLSGPGSTSSHDLPAGVSLQVGDVICTLGVGYDDPGDGLYGWIDDDAQSWLAADLATGATASRGDGAYVTAHAGAVHYGAAGNTSIDYEYLGDNSGPIARSYILIRGAQYTYTAQTGNATGRFTIDDGPDPESQCDGGESHMYPAVCSGVAAGSIAIAAGRALLNTDCGGGAPTLGGASGWTSVDTSPDYELVYTIGVSGSYSLSYSETSDPTPGVHAVSATMWLAPLVAPDPDEDVLYNPNDTGSVAHVVISDNVLEDYGIDTGIVLENAFYGVVSGNYGEYSTFKATFCSYLQVTGNHVAFANGMLLDAVWYSSIEANHVNALNGDAAFTLSGNSIRNTIMANKANAWRDYQLLDHAVVLGASTAENSIAFNDFRVLYDVSQVDDAGTDNVILLNLPETTVEAGAIALDDLTDVSASGATDGQLLAWDEATGNWVPVDPSAGSGDMAKATYDLNDNGVVDAAESVPWSGVTDAPATFPPEAHSHTVSDISDFPTEFPPSAHTHDWNEIVNRPALGYLFFHDDASDIAGYEELSESPSTGAEEDDSVSITAASGEVLIASYITEDAAGWGVTKIPAGVWDFSIYTYASSLAGGASYLVGYVYKRSQAGAETLLFSGTFQITSTAVTLYEWVASQGEYTLDATDRLVVKIYGKTDRVVATAVHFVHEGSLHDSHFHFPGLQNAVGDMLQSIYDTDADGVVDEAASVPWSGVTDAPTTFPPDAHTHAVTDITDFPTIPASLDDLSDVDATGVADGQFLRWDEANGNWVPGTPSGAGDMLASVYDTNGNNIVDAAESVPWSGITDAPATFPPEAHAHALADLSDVDLTGVTDGYILVYESGGWVVAEPTATPGETPTIDIGQLHEHAYSEDHSGECNGTLTTVILANEFSPGTVQVWLNGLRQRPGRDYDEVGYDSITFSTAPYVGDDLLIDYEVA